LKLIDLLNIQAGGPGSGCNPLKGRCGRFSKNQKKMLKEKGHLISMKPKPQKFQGTPIGPSNIVSKTQITQKVGNGKFLTYTYTILKPKNVHPSTPGFTSTPVNFAPPDRPHPMKGSFVEVMRLQSPAEMKENRTSIVYDAGQRDEGQGSTLFVHKYRTGPTSGHAVLEEFDREGNEIIGTHQIEFATGKTAREFLRYRYGIDVRWTKEGTK